jgi:hypothetical protein
VPLEIEAEFKGTLPDLRKTIISGYPDLTFHLLVMSDGRTQKLSVLDNTGSGWELEFNPDTYINMKWVIRIPHKK